MQGIVKRITPYIAERATYTINLTIKLYGADSIHQNAVLKDTKAFPLDYSDGRFVSFRKMMRYAEVEFGTNSLGAFYDLAGYDALCQEAGGR
jgi:hypothetical protein